MNFALEPSLEHIAFVHVTATLWDQRDIRDFSLRSFQSPNSTLCQKFHGNLFVKSVDGKQVEWNKMEERVIEKLSQLTIPATLKEKLLGYIKPVGLQIFKWMKYHVKCCSLDLGVQNKFCWTLHGTIDKKKTAEILIKDGAIDITARYKLACIYCLVDDIPKLWYKLSEIRKISFYNKENIGNNLQMELLTFWGQYIRERAVSMDSIDLNPFPFTDSYMFQRAAENGNKAATEYFLQKLTQREELLLNSSLDVLKKVSEGFPIITSPINEYFSEVFCFLFSQMSNDQQIQISKEYPFLVLKCLLDCPWHYTQNSFVEKVSRLWNFLLGNRYYDVLVQIIKNVNAGCKDFNYQKLFRYIWQQIPRSDKSSIIMNNNFYGLLNVLLQNNDRESIKLVFQDATVDERNKVMFGVMGQFVWEAMIYREEWSLLKFFIPLCLSSKDEIITFKQTFLKHIQVRRKWHSPDDIIVHTKKKSREFFHILDDFIRSYDKKKRSGEGNYNLRKRINNNLISD